MHYAQSILLLFILASTLIGAKGQETNLNGWLFYLNTTKINKQLSFYFDGQLRSNAQVKPLQTLLLRPGLNFSVKQNITATLGYAFIENRRAVGEVSGMAPEHRIWEQVQVSHPVGFTTLNHRFRLEQRFISNYFVSNNSLRHRGNVFSNRFRYFFREIVPFKRSVKFTKRYYAALQNEIFVNLGDKSHVNRKYFDQNRAYLALGYRFSPKLDAEAGYMNQYMSGRDKLFKNNHILQIAVYNRL